jgi:hypothetical protein
MAFKVSLTARDFFRSASEIIEENNWRCVHYGDRGGLYRLRIDTNNSKSYIFNSLDCDEPKGINNSINALLTDWGGVEVLSSVIHSEKINDLYLEINCGKENVSAISISVESISMLSRVGARLIFSY